MNNMTFLKYVTMTAHKTHIILHTAQGTFSISLKAALENLKNRQSHFLPSKRL